MPYIATNYANSSNAPLGKWVCAPTSKLRPFDDVPEGPQTKGLDLCGQCVSYVKAVCVTLPATASWKRGSAVKDNDKVVPGTVIATFNDLGKYEGHAAVYVSQNAVGITVYDQYVTGPVPKPVGQRVLRWGALGRSNNGDNFHVVE